MKVQLKLCWLLSAVGLLAGCASPGGSTGVMGDTVECGNGLVVSISGPASEAGVTILKSGGNAVDAAVATAFALAVTYPPGGNIGGGGFMIVHPAPGKGKPVAINYREAAPQAAFSNMFTPEESQFTRRAVAIPGTVRGMALAHSRFGSRPWAELLQPAIGLARHGFPIDRNLAESMNETLAAAKEFSEFQRVYGNPGGGPWKEGDRLVQPDLARTLETLAREGPDSFYRGTLARSIVAEMQRGGGLITVEDLSTYQAFEVMPLHARYRDKFDVYVPPSPSSGGTVLVEELNILNSFDLKTMGRWSGPTLHVLSEAMRRANRDRAEFLGDPAFVSIPSRLTSVEHGRELARSINLGKATPSAALSRELSGASESPNTTHFSIIDRSGMAVANTYTLERLWGSRVVVKDMGFLLNNDMRAFNLFPGTPDTNGVTATAANNISPGKRPLSSQCPTIVAQDGRVKLVTGSPGSQSIPHTILCTLINLVDFDLPLRSAVDLPRISHSWFPDQVVFEAPELYPDSVQALQKLGHTVVKTGPLPQGDAHTIWVQARGRYVGAADRRRSEAATAAGY
jgi:gamma-glutamyltranspeptidase/glutathione hydrolase